MPFFERFGLHNIFTGDPKKKPISLYDEPILPESVRYALGYKGAKFGREELDSLITNGMTDAAIFLLIKAYEDNPAAQKDAFGKILLATTATTDKWAIRPGLKELTAENPEISVITSKLGQMSRVGLNWLHDQYAALASELVARPDHASPAFVSHSSLYGLRPFIDLYSHASPAVPLYFIRNDWIEDHESPQYGYKVTLGDTPSVDFLNKSDPRPQNVVTIIDTRKTQEHENDVWQFLTGDASVSPDRMRTLTDITELYKKT